MPLYDFGQYKYTPDKPKAKTYQCMAITNDGEYCKIPVLEQDLDRMQLCHIHHPDREFQQNKRIDYFVNQLIKKCPTQEK